MLLFSALLIQIAVTGGQLFYRHVLRPESDERDEEVFNFLLHRGKHAA